MPITDLLLTGLNLMFLGMGIVFIFLVLLVFSMLGMSKLAMLTEKQVVGQTEAAAITPLNDPSGEVRGDLVAVIAAAVIRYRTTHS